jgi:hypothetical protein
MVSFQRGRDRETSRVRAVTLRRLRWLGARPTELLVLRRGVRVQPSVLDRRVRLARP